MARFERLQCRLPGRLARVGYGREVYLVRNRHLSFAFQPSPRYLFPGNDVIDEFPDAVCIRDGSGSGLFSRHAVERLAQRRAMPRLPLLSAFKLAVMRWVSVIALRFPRSDSGFDYLGKTISHHVYLLRENKFYHRLRARTSCSVAAHHNLAVRSRLPVASVLPSGENATL